MFFYFNVVKCYLNVTDLVSLKNFEFLKVLTKLKNFQKYFISRWSQVR